MIFARALRFRRRGSGKDTGQASLSIKRLSKIWQLDVGPPLNHDGASMIFTATRRDGSLAVLKLCASSSTTAREAEALTIVDGRGAIRLLEADVEERALLLERAVPGHSLAEESERHVAIELAVQVMSAWWHPVREARTIESVNHVNMRHHAELARRRRWLAGRVPSKAIDLALEVLSEHEDEAVLLHTDLHLHNVVLSERGWLAVDPQPLVGPRSYDLEPVTRVAAPTSRPYTLSEIHRLADCAQIDRAQATRTVLARALVVGSWSVETGATAWGWAHIDAIVQAVGVGS